MGIELDEDEIWAELANAHTAVITTLRRDGSPVALPVWFATLDRRIYLSTPSKAKKLARIRHDARASLLVESGLAWAELRAVHMNGVLVEVTDTAEADAANAVLNDKYVAFRPAVTTLPDATRSHYAGRTMLRFDPDGRTLSWDNSRIRLRR